MDRVQMNLVVTALAAALIAVTGCRKSVEGETKKFDKSVLEAEKTIALYPGFQPALSAELTTAQNKMAAALEVADEEQTSKMAAASKMLSAGTFAKLRSVEQALRQLKKESLELTGETKWHDVGKTRVTEEANRMHAAVEAVLKTGAADATAASAILGKALTDIKVVRQGMTPLLTAQRKAIKARQQAAKPSGTSRPKTSTPSTGKPPRKAPTTGTKTSTPVKTAVKVKCKYCGQSNVASASKCGSCGASVK